MEAGPANTGKAGAVHRVACFVDIHQFSIATMD